MAKTHTTTHPYTKLTDVDIFLFKEGTHFHLFEKLGAHPMVLEGTSGTYFAVWAPNAKKVHVIGSFNGWNKRSHPLFPRWDSSGIWEGFIPGVKQGDLYKYSIVSASYPKELEKGDPFAFHWETPPKTASIVWDISYAWNEKRWLNVRHKKNHLNAPISIYEIHFGSWQRYSNHQPLTYRDVAERLPPYLVDMGFTHVEFMPLMEHPFYGSWGYQKTGYFAPSSRYGTPQDFMYLIEQLHEHQIGVFLDWVPSHFPSDGYSLAFFDGTALFEHADPRQGFHPDWQSYIFNYTRHEVRSFLFSSAAFWIDKYHADGLRVDAVSSMLYLDYSRKPGEWVPNRHGGHENLDAISFLQELNTHLYKMFPHIQMIAEESTAWPKVSRPTTQGGLGFGLKWNMGWMHDTLKYFDKDPIHRKYHHQQLLFSMYYFFNENFTLSLSHDEVVYGKKSLLSKMPGDEWQKFANLRLLYSYMFTHPGKKLLFMGGELAQWHEWNHETALDWYLLQYPSHQGIQKLLKDLNRLYQQETALYEQDFNPAGFEWVSLHDHEHSVIAFSRKGLNPLDTLLIIFNFTPVPRYNYLLEIKTKSCWIPIFNSDASIYGGSNLLHSPSFKSSEQPPYTLTLTLPPLAMMIFKQKL